MRAHAGALIGTTPTLAVYGPVDGAPGVERLAERLAA